MRLVSSEPTAKKRGSAGTVPGAVTRTPGGDDGVGDGVAGDGVAGEGDADGDGERDSGAAEVSGDRAAGRQALASSASALTTLRSAVRLRTFRLYARAPRPLGDERELDVKRGTLFRSAGRPDPRMG